MFCEKCGAKMDESAAFCPACGAEALPPGIKGWSWGAFLLNWIWAIGNRTWWGLLALIPYVGFIVALWLGFKGREMAWKNRSWDSVEHFNRVQKRWSQWGAAVVIVPAVIGILAAIAIPAYQDYVRRAKAVTTSVDNRSINSYVGNKVTV